MASLSDLGDLLVRAAHLLALALAPAFLSPAPAPGGGPVAAAIAGVLLVVVLVAAGRLRSRLGGREGIAAAALVGAAVAVALIEADVFRGDRGPIGRGALYVGVPLWVGLAVVAGAVAARRLGPAYGQARARGAAALAVVLIGAGLFAASARRLSSPEQMYLAELRHDGDDAFAVEALTRAPFRAKKYDDTMAILDRCLAANPGACACLARRAAVGLRTLAPAQALEEARAAHTRCPASRAAHAVVAEALAIHGDAEAGEQEARAGLASGDDAALRYSLALSLTRIGRRAEAIEEAKHALRLGAGRDAALLVGKLAIEAGDLDAAVEALRPVVATDPDDAEAIYDLALVADKRNDYNRAREGYLGALRADPRLASARYNLVMLTLRSGAVAEARHHAERYAATFPGDPTAVFLTQRVAAAK